MSHKCAKKIFFFIAHLIALELTVVKYLFVYLVVVTVVVVVVNRRDFKYSCYVMITHVPSPRVLCLLVMAF